MVGGKGTCCSVGKGAGSWLPDHRHGPYQGPGNVAARRDELVTKGKKGGTHIGKATTIVGGVGPGSPWERRRFHGQSAVKPIKKKKITSSKVNRV